MNAQGAGDRDPRVPENGTRRWRRAVFGALAWLRDTLGASFVQGVLFHTGPRAFVLDERIVALPISTIWGATGPMVAR